MEPVNVLQEKKWIEYREKKESRILANEAQGYHRIVANIKHDERSSLSTYKKMG